MSSTNKQIQFVRYSEAFPVGTVCVTDVQEQGKGRGGNVWTSPEGCLMASIAINTSIAGTTQRGVMFEECCSIGSASIDFCFVLPFVIMQSVEGHSTTIVGKESLPANHVTSFIASGYMPG